MRKQLNGLIDKPESLRFSQDEIQALFYFAKSSRSMKQKVVHMKPQSRRAGVPPSSEMRT